MSPPDASAAPSSRSPRAVSVFERRQFQRGVSAPIVRAAEWQSLSELDTLLARVNALYDAAEAEVQKAREQGYADGFAEGLDRVKQQMSEQLASLNERRARVLGDAVGRIGDLACAIVARIAPSFDASQVVPELVKRAVESAQAEQFLMIRVHPDAREGVEQGLGAVRQAHPGVGVIELVDDESLDPLSCVVVSEAGEVRAGVSQQIEAIRAALAQASSAAGT